MATARTTSRAHATLAGKVHCATSRSHVSVSSAVPMVVVIGRLRCSKDVASANRIGTVHVARHMCPALVWTVAPTECAITTAAGASVNLVGLVTAAIWTSAVGSNVVHTVSAHLWSRYAGKSASAAVRMATTRATAQVTVTRRRVNLSLIPPKSVRKSTGASLHMARVIAKKGGPVRRVRHSVALHFAPGLSAIWTIDQCSAVAIAVLGSVAVVDLLLLSLYQDKALLTWLQ
jgi:hypothetical protein